MQKIGESPPGEISEAAVLKGSLVVGLGLAVGQGTGFIRQAAIGYVSGTGSDADALMAAMAPVELWWAVMSLTVIFGFVPKFSASDPSLRYSFGSIFRPAARLSVFATIFVLVFADVLIRLFAPGLDPATHATAVKLLRVMAPAQAAIGVSFVYSALLFSHRRFGMGSFHHVFLNTATLLGGLAGYGRWGPYGFAAGYALGSYLQLAAAHWSSRKLIPLHSGSGKGPGLADLLAGPAPIMGQALAMELITAVSRAYASTFGPGMTSAFDYGYKLFRVPLALLVVPLSHALLPELSSHQGSAGRRKTAQLAAERGAMLTVVGGAVVMIVIMLLSRPIVEILFQRGQFQSASTDAVETILLGYMPVIIGRGLTDFLSRSLFAMGKVQTPLAATVLALALNFAICLLLPADEPLLIGLGAVVGFSFGAAWIVWSVVRSRRHG